MAITRDDVVHDRLRQRIREEAANGGNNPLLCEELFQGSLQNMLEQFRAHEELWVFAYGSLIWSPTFEFVDDRVANLPGHARKFCLWAESGRGSPQQPGLWLALDEASPEEHCSGVAFKIDNAVREYEMLMLWRREMVTGAYVPVIREAFIGGERKPCLCLLANKTHARYVGNLPENRLIEAIATAEGHLGTCREYLFNLYDKLCSLGVNDNALEQLSERVISYRTARSLAP